mmetsp:Transcript_23974/g.36458  ORF Transcript_23974/g.36458 Transcript_23974/m.36458 type:complete len:454 (+) Transcript_23974:447-1808(+)
MSMICCCDTIAFNGECYDSKNFYLATCLDLYNQTLAICQDVSAGNLSMDCYTPGYCPVENNSTPLLSATFLLIFGGVICSLFSLLPCCIIFFIGFTATLKNEINLNNEHDENSDDVDPKQTEISRQQGIKIDAQASIEKYDISNTNAVIGLIGGFGLQCLFLGFLTLNYRTTLQTWLWLIVGCLLTWSCSFCCFVWAANNGGFDNDEFYETDENGGGPASVKRQVENPILPSVRYCDFSTNFFRVLLIFASQMALLIMYALSLYDANPLDFTSEMTYFFYFMGWLVQQAYAIGKVEEIRDLFRVWGIILSSALKNGAKGVEIKEYGSFSLLNISLRMIMSGLVDVVGSSTIILLLPIQLAQEETVMGFILNVVAVHIIVDLDNIRRPKEQILLTMDVFLITDEEQNQFHDDSIATDEYKNGKESDAGEQVFKNWTDIDKETKDGNESDGQYEC